MEASMGENSEKDFLELEEDSGASVMIVGLPDMEQMGSKELGLLNR